MPETVRPRQLLALPTLDVAAHVIGALATAVGTDHPATTGLVALGALQERGRLPAVGEDVGNLEDDLVRAPQARRVVLVGFERLHGRLVGAAGSLAARAVRVQTGGALQVAGVPGLAGVGVAWLVFARVVVAAPDVEGAAEVEFLGEAC